MNDTRKEAMIYALASGMTLQQVGDKCGLMRQRVSQIVGEIKKIRKPLGEIRRDECMAIANMHRDRVNALRREGKSFPEISRLLHIDMKVLETGGFEPKAFKHGTRNSYNCHKCRCRLCTDAASATSIAAQRKYRAQGRCTDCGKPAQGKCLCKKLMAQAVLANAKYRAKKRAEQIEIAAAQGKEKRP